jgi:ABC-type Fe3+-hydroxamate transport system substrate-binding protein/adenosylcobinamide amidohydrolase
MVKEYVKTVEFRRINKDSMKRGKIFQKVIPIITIAFLTVIGSLSPALSHPTHLSFIDGSGKKIVITKTPSRVVSLVPAVTEMIFKLDAGSALKGITYHDIPLPGITDMKIVGGFFSPSIEKIEEINPDVIFISSLHDEVKERFRGKAILIELNAHSVQDIYDNIAIIGKIFHKEERASMIIDSIKEDIEVISKKVKSIPLLKKKRVVRLMGRDSIMAPGDDSFQNAYIRAAGGIPPIFNKRGNVVPVTKEEWIKFNPQIIYACGKDSEAAKIILNEPGWKDVEAVRDGKIFYFPCDLTCRASVNAGYFVSWLSSKIYEDEFFKKENLVIREKIFRTKDIDVDLDYISHAHIDYSYIHDFLNKTLIIDFKIPMNVVSTLEGWRTGIVSVGNHYMPPQNWGFEHKVGLKGVRERVYTVINRAEDNSSFLFTGADMDNLSIKRESFRDIVVYALVTAGVRSNAVRMSADEGKFYEPGIINIILMTNTKLSPRAMTRAIISATEAKTAALEDLDIRSSQSPRLYQATGTGTDNIIVVEGDGVPIDNTSGHSKTGELIARAVYAGVKEAIYLQNGIRAGRSIFQRLKERKIALFDLIDRDRFKNINRQRLINVLEEILMQSRYASFIETAFVISDAYEKGLITNLETFQLWCKDIAGEIAGREARSIATFITNENIPIVMRMAFNSILQGLYLKMEK